MIRMPRRSVTRFFIPLIDVLLLLFCIFLLMEFNSGSKITEQDVLTESQNADIEILSAELEARNKELRQFQADRPKLVRLNELEEEIKRLREANQRGLQQRSFFKPIDIDRFSGQIAFYDEQRKADPLVPIPDEKAAQALIARHQQEAKALDKTDVYYYFMRSRVTEAERKQGKLVGGFPTRGQILQYKKWFSKVANNLSEYL